MKKKRNFAKVKSFEQDIFLFSFAHVTGFFKQQNQLLGMRYHSQLQVFVEK